MFNQIWTDNSYVYAVTCSGLKIYQLASESEYAYIDYVDGFTSVWASDEKVYLGTSSSGVKYFNVSVISGSVSSPYDLSNHLMDYSEFNVTSSEIRYLHGCDNYLLVCTALGVDAVKHHPQGYRSYTICSGTQKCFMTSTGKFYYTISGSSNWYLNIKNNPLSDWAESDGSHVTGSGIFSPGIKLNDIYITENTGSDGSSNTIFTATSSGVYVIDETDDTYSFYTTSSSGTNLKGNIDDFSSIWVDNNKMYVGSVGYLTVVDLSTNTVWDWYSESHVGRANESLNSGNIEDINVN
jgi:hypothetical protein